MEIELDYRIPHLVPNILLFNYVRSLDLNLAFVRFLLFWLLSWVVQAGGVLHTILLVWKRSTRHHVHTPIIYLLLRHEHLLHVVGVHAIRVLGHFSLILLLKLVHHLVLEHGVHVSHWKNIRVGWHPAVLPVHLADLWHAEHVHWIHRFRKEALWLLSLNWMCCFNGFLPWLYFWFWLRNHSWLTHLLGRIIILNESNVLVNVHFFSLFDIQEELLSMAPDLGSRARFDMLLDLLPVFSELA